MNPLTGSNLPRLKEGLQSVTPGGLERFAAAAIGRLLDVPVAVASSGFQFGGDAGSSGRLGRHFRIECKRYQDSSELSRRELLGEIDQALNRDPALESWILTATREVPHQLQEELVAKGVGLGVPVIILDWSDDEIGTLAALCAFAPDLLERQTSAPVRAAAAALTRHASSQIDHIRRELQDWQAGFEQLRLRSHQEIRKIGARRHGGTVTLEPMQGVRPRRIPLDQHAPPSPRRVEHAIAAVRPE